MESAQILATVNSQESYPGSWLVFPLQRRTVLIGIFGWIFGAVIGGLLLFFMVPIMVPQNYEHGVFAAVLSTLVLGLVAYVCVGSLWALITDILRLRWADKHIIILTPDDFVKQEGNKITHVPLEYIQHVTARGTPPVERDAQAAAEETRSSTMGESIGSLFIGRAAASGIRKGGFGRRRMRTPTTLAFVDTRTDKEVVVVTDKAYGDPFYIGETLTEYVKSAESRASSRASAK